MEFREALARRRMVRNYQPRPVPEDKLDRIATAALRAPSAGNSRGVAVVVITDPTTRSALATAAGEADYVARGFDPWISRAPAHLVLLVSEAAYHRRYRMPDKLDGEEIAWPVPYWWVDAGAALMAMLLAAVDEGLAAGFLGFHALSALPEGLGIPPEYAPVGVVTVGYPAPDRRSRSLDLSSPGRLIHRERWDPPGGGGP
jgi:nitroreductase